jgi:hypothetical protein
MNIEIGSTMPIGKTGNGLKITTSLKTGAVASNPSLLNTNQFVVSGLRVQTNTAGGARPCTTVIMSD